MTNLIRICGVASMLAGAAFAPAAAWAQTQQKTGATTSPDNLSAQEREILTLATDLSKRCTDRMERWIANREVTEEKLFSFLYYPMPKTDPPKFTTDWDRLSDRDVLPVEESVLTKSPTILYAVMVDKNGYLPTHNQRYSQPLTGNAANDLVNNRTKRIYQDQTGLASPVSGCE
jgi:methyl-accepting chemotaxis protein